MAESNSYRSKRMSKEFKEEFVATNSSRELVVS